jgi:hypothetical protein
VACNPPASVTMSVIVVVPNWFAADEGVFAGSAVQEVVVGAAVQEVVAGVAGVLAHDVERLRPVCR